MGVAFAWRILAAAVGHLRPRLDYVRRLMQVGRHIFVRTSSLYLAFVVAGAVAARFGEAEIAAHQIAFQLWIFIALVLDAIAIAGMVIVGRMLGAGDAEGAYAASLRMIWMSVVAGAMFAAAMLGLIDVLPLVFTSDDAVLDQARELWPIFALMQPLNGAVFALDGILIGAGDTRFLMWSMLVSGLGSAVVALAALEYDWGIRGVWFAVLVLIVLRLATMSPRFARRRWLVTGWA
jgi:putative MATE family efflux protein